METAQLWTQGAKGPGRCAPHQPLGGLQTGLDSKDDVGYTMLPVSTNVCFPRKRGADRPIAFIGSSKPSVADKSSHSFSQWPSPIRVFAEPHSASATQVSWLVSATGALRAAFSLQLTLLLLLASPTTCLSFCAISVLHLLHFVLGVHM